MPTPIFIARSFEAPLIRKMFSLSCRVLSKFAFFARAVGNYVHVKRPIYHAFDGLF